jgi:hypothetical protein
MANELFWGNKIPTLWLAILDPLCSLIARRFDSRLLLQINSGRHRKVIPVYTIYLHLRNSTCNDTTNRNQEDSNKNHERHEKNRMTNELTFEYLASINGSANLSSTLCKFTMKLSVATVSDSTCAYFISISNSPHSKEATARNEGKRTCIPARFTLSRTTVAKYSSTRSRASGEVRTRVLKIWKRDDWELPRVQAIRRVNKQNLQSREGA